MNSLLNSGHDKKNMDEAGFLPIPLPTSSWSPFTALGSTIRRYAQFDGRASRSEFWFTALANMLISSLMMLLFFWGLFICIFGDYNLVTCIVLTSIVGVAYILYSLFLFIPMLALTIRRLHDTGRSGAEFCFYFIPIVGPFIVLAYLLSPSTPANRYGFAPDGIADKKEGGKFLNGIIWPFSHTFGNWKISLLMWPCGIFLCWFSLYLTTSSYIDFHKYDIEVAKEYRQHRRDNRNINTYPYIAEALNFNDASDEELYDIIEILLKEKADPNMRGYNIAQPLHLAIEKDYPKCTELLLQNGADPNAEPYLLTAINKDNTKLLRLLIEHGADLNKEHPICLAAQTGKAEALKLLIENGADVNSDNPLLSAVYNNHPKCVELLIEAGADINQKNYSDSSPLYHAVQQGLVECVRILISHKADVNETHRGQTIFETAVKQGDIDIVKLLIEAGADINNGSTSPLAYAYDYGSTELAYLILNSGANPNVTYSNGMTLLNKAIRKKDAEFAQKLINLGANVNQGEPHPLLNAYQYNLMDLVNTIIDAGANVNVTGDNNTPILIYAIKQNQIELIKKLIAAGAEINKSYGSRSQSSTPLNCAVTLGNEDLVQLLIESNAKIDTKSLQSAICNKNKNLVQLLLSKVTNINKHNPEELINSAISNEVPEFVVMLAKAGATANWVDVSNKLLNFKKTSTITELINAGIPVHGDMLITAAQNGQSEIINILLEKGIDINYQDKKQNTALLVAIENGHELTAKQLLKSGANPNIGGKAKNTTALNLAIRQGNKELVASLIEAKATINIDSFKDAIHGKESHLVQLLINNVSDINDYSPDTLIDYALKNKAPEYIVMLGKAKAKAKWVNISCRLLEQNYPNTVIELLKEEIAVHEDILIAAAKNGHAAVISKILEYAVDINYINNSQNTALLVAINNKHNNCAFLLLASGANPNIGNSKQGSLLTNAVSNNEIELTKQLLKAGADINIKDDEGRTVLFTAIKNKNPELVSMLLGAGADKNVIDAKGTTPLLYALQNETTPCAELLIKSGADINLKLPLHYAIACGKKEYTEMLLKAGADLDLPTETGHTLLTQAIRNSDKVLIEQLIQAGANVNIPAKNGDLPLLYAIRTSNEDLIEQLIQAGANVNISNENGDTPLLYAIRTSNEDLIEQLIQAGANVNTPAENGDTPLLCAIAYNKMDLVNQLLEAGADANIRYPLLSAIKQKDKELIKLLLSHGANPNVAPKMSRTALIEAIMTNDMEIIQALLEAKANPNLADTYEDGQFSVGVYEHPTSGFTPLIVAILCFHSGKGYSICHPGYGVDISICHPGYGDLGIKYRDHKNYNLINALIKAGANLNLADSSNRTPIYYAAVFRNKDLFYYLLKKGAYPSYLDRWARLCTDYEYSYPTELRSEFRKIVNASAVQKAKQASRAKAYTPKSQSKQKGNEAKEKSKKR